MIQPLQSLRFLFILLVFTEHFPVSPEQPHLIAQAGPLGVTFFLILSGFVMGLGYEERVLQPSFSLIGGGGGLSPTKMGAPMALTYPLLGGVDGTLDPRLWGAVTAPAPAT